MTKDGREEHEFTAGSRQILITGDSECSEPPDSTPGLYVDSCTASCRVWRDTCQCSLPSCQMSTCTIFHGCKGLCAEPCGQQHTCDWGTV